MRLLSLACALAAVLPLAASAQTQLAPGVTYVPPTGTTTTLPGGTPYIAPGAVGQGPLPNQVGVAEPAPMPPQSIPGNPVSAPSVDLNAQQPGTATEQGFGAAQDAEQARRVLEDLAARSTPRQKGIVVPAPMLRNPVGTDPSAREWLGNWSWALGNVGVSQEKIRFEASRLSRADFETWASRQLRFRHGEQARVEVLERPALDPAQ